ncbi:PaaI family thioesterase [Donghicola sp. C2-DW-16]|uniref:Medium/long-chain acyl-CoA thioesterase YigI n=1 Tax=Donghicola mangrovi TaxID=2729614 RepID=A0ABX2PBX4_9RHOB|nr:PaaI family thioesterase [Donghicola mangrovi]NVO26660.1 PaaI family thioesterase [Donghicola mangrovi]
MTDTTEARLRASFAQQSMMQTIGAELTSVADGTVTITAPVGDGVRQQQGFAHGGMLFSIGDSAAGYAALTTQPEGTEVMTIEMKINYLAPAAGQLEAVGRVIKAGRRMVVVAADIWADDGTRRRQVAMMQGTMIPVAS